MPVDYRARVEAGLCGRCGKPARPGKTSCAACAAYNAALPRPNRNAYQRNRRRARVADGLCGCCGKVAVPNRTLCQPCASRLSVTQRRYYERMKAAYAASKEVNE